MWFKTKTVRRSDWMQGLLDCEDLVKNEDFSAEGARCFLLAQSYESPDYHRGVNAYADNYEFRNPMVNTTIWGVLQE